MHFRAAFSNLYCLTCLYYNLNKAQVYTNIFIFYTVSHIFSHRVYNQKQNQFCLLVHM